jgi:hypothetical protein
MFLGLTLEDSKVGGARLYGDCAEYAGDDCGDELEHLGYGGPIDLNHRAECFVSTDYRKIGFWILGDLEDV